MRTFVAVMLPEAFVDEVASLSRRLAEVCEGRFLPPESLHLTLAFLGEVGEVQARDAMDALDAACADVGPVELFAEGLGTFGRGRDTTLWLGVRRTDELGHLAARVRDELGRRDLAFDGRPFLPHVTLARKARLPRGLLPDLTFPLPVDATRVRLLRSILGADGARYKPLYEVTLGA